MIQKTERYEGWDICCIPFHAESIEELAGQMKDCLAKIGGAVRHFRIESSVTLYNDVLYTDDGFAEYNRRMDKLLRVWPIGAEAEIADIHGGKLRGNLCPYFFPEEGVKVLRKPVTAAMLKGEDV